MVKIKGKRKREQLKIIKWGIKAKLSANKIQKQLQTRKLGLRRKVLLAEIRSIKKQKIKPEKRIRHIPKKYIEKPKPIKKPTHLYRVSYIILDIPVHSKPFKRRYLGFRLNAFSFNKNLLLQKHNFLKDLLIKLSSNYLGSNILEWNEWPISFGREYPTIIYASENLNNIWIFRVEQEGYEIYSRSGAL